MEYANRHLQGKIDDLEAELAAAKNEISELNRKLAGMRGLQDENDELRGRIDELEEALADAQRTIAGLRATVKALRDQEDAMEALKAQIMELEIQLANKDVTIKTQQTEIDDLNRQLQGMRSLQQENYELRSRIEDLQGKVRDLEAEIQAMQDDAARSYAKLRQEVERLTGIKFGLEGDLTDERDVSHGLKSEISRLLATIEHLKRVAEENQANAAMMKEMESEIMRLQNIIRSLETKTLAYTEEWRGPSRSNSPVRGGY